VVLGVMLALGLGPFLNQAIQTDDTLFVWTAQWIQKHPADFFGFSVNWWGSAIPMWAANYNPPLLSYLLAGAGTLFNWHEAGLHLVSLLIAFAAAGGIFALARMWCQRPLLAAVLAILTPAFFVLSTTLMCDLLMLACWTWAVVLWEYASQKQRSYWCYAGAGVLAGVAVLAKYSAVTLLPLLFVLGVFAPAQRRWAIIWLVIPVVMVAAFEWATSRMYGHGLIELASQYSRTHRFGFAGGWRARAIIGLAFAGGSLLPVLFVSPWLWRRRPWTIGGAVLIGVLLALFSWQGDLGIIHAWVDSEQRLMKMWDFRLQVLLLTLAGIHLLLLLATEIWQRRDRITLVLVLWVGSVFFFATVLNWTVNARSFLPAVPALAILAVRRMSVLQEEGKTGKPWLLAVPVAASAIIALVLAVANFQMANSARTAAERITSECKTAGHTLWLDGHSGFQYYMEKYGAQPLDVEKSLLQPGDFVVVTLTGDFVELPSRSVAPVKNLNMRQHSWVNLQGSSARSAAGFYTSDCGPLPFAAGAPAPDEYFVVKVCSRLQYQSKPSNPQEVEAGAVPDFHKIDYLRDDEADHPENPAAADEVKLARKAETDGNAELAATHYQTALSLDASNAVAKCGLAFILATSDRPNLRDTKRAVQLASEAVKFTNWRQPEVIEILATSLASDGHYGKALAAVQLARDLAVATGAHEQAANCARLMEAITAAMAAPTTQNQPDQR